MRAGGAGSPPVSAPSADNRLEQARERQLKELMEMQVVKTRDQGERVLDGATKTLRQLRESPDAPGLRNTPITADAAKQGAQERGRVSGTAQTRENAADLPRLVADFQRQQGLPVTGKLDPNTVNALKDKGLVIQQPVVATKDAFRPKEDAGQTRANRGAVEQQTRARLDSPALPKGERARDVAAREGGPREAGPKDNATPVDRAFDPARLLASLVMAGFAGKGKQGLDDAIKSFQASQGLPPTGKIDQKTEEALKQEGHVAAEQPEHAKPSEKAVDTKQQIKRALAETVTTKNAADRDVVKDPLRPQANTQQPTTTADVAARAQAANLLEGATAAADKARLDTVMAQQNATERGVSEGTGDPNATQGHGEIAGEGAGQRGKGGVSGGGSLDSTATTGAMAEVEGVEGDEDAVGNAEAGDDDFENEERGNANADGEGDQPGEEGEYWEVPPLSEQVREALEKILRDDDGSGPVTYTWDVTFLRPGTYAAGQPAEELWHVAVNKATAFDGVWQQAADAISSRMLYGEPDAEPATIDDFIAALRRARVR